MESPAAKMIETTIFYTYMYKFLADPDGCAVLA